MINYEKEIWEGWKVKDFINQLSPILSMVMSNRSWKTPLKTRQEIKEWCMDNQPYYKDYIPEVVDHFCKIYKIK